MTISITDSQNSNAKQEDVAVATKFRGYLSSTKFASKLLSVAARFWFVVATLGIWIFGVFILVHFGGAAITGNISTFNTGDGSKLATVSILVHVLLASVVIFGGSLQLIPQIRSRFPRFHQWNGRIFVTTSFIVSIAGLFMLWTRVELPGGKAMMIALNILVLLVITFSVLTVRNAMNKKIADHRKWALRLFLVVNAGWFFRVCMVAWSMIFGTVGFDPETFEGPFIQIMAFAQYLLPLAFLELYFQAQKTKSAFYKSMYACLLIFSTLIMAGGIFGATMGMWLPKII